MSSLGRRLTLTLPSNVLALVACVCATVWSTGDALRSSGTGLFEALAHGVAFGLAIFLTWALARELDPDRPAVAAFALGLVAPLAVTGEPRALPLLALVVATRVVAGTTGRRMTVLDPFALAGVAWFAAFTPAGLFAAGAVADAPRFARRFDQREGGGRTMLARSLALGAIVSAVVAHETFGSWDPNFVKLERADWIIVGTALLIGTLAVRRTAQPFTACDSAPRGAQHPELVDRHRVRAARGMAVIVTALTVALLGTGALHELPGAFAALAALALSRGFLRRSV